MLLDSEYEPTLHFWLEDEGLPTDEYTVNNSFWACGDGGRVSFVKECENECAAGASLEKNDYCYVKMEEKVDVGMNVKIEISL